MHSILKSAASGAGQLQRLVSAVPSLTPTNKSKAAKTTSSALKPSSIAPIAQTETWPRPGAWNARATQKIELQPREFTLLEYLLRNAGKVVSKAMIIEPTPQQD